MFIFFALSLLNEISSTAAINFFFIFISHNGNSVFLIMVLQSKYKTLLILVNLVTKIFKNNILFVLEENC